MKRALLAAAALAGVAAGAAVFAPRPAPPVGPLARFPEAIDLGDRQPGEVVEADFPLSNAGDQPLTVSDIATSCSCAGLEAERDGRRVRVTEVVIPPGSTAPLRFRVSVGVPPGRSQTVRIGFRTSDPAHPTGDVPATVRRVVGRPFARPESVHLGAVRGGTRSSAGRRRPCSRPPPGTPAPCTWSGPTRRRSPPPWPPARPG